MRNFTIIFRITNSCNLNCTYCYDKGNRINVKKENEEFYNKIPEIVNNINKLWENKEESSEIIFHGGEPLIINARNYEILLDKIKNQYKNVRFSIQTNATLLNEDFIKIFKKYNVHIGISLDGFDKNTNQYRIYRNGKNSFEDVMKKIELLKLNNMSFGIIMTLTKNVVNREEEFYKFICDNNLRCNIRPAFQCSETDVDFMTNETYYEFFKKIFNIWIKDESKKLKITQIREIYDEFAKVLEPSYNNKSCSSSGNCFINFISLDCMGNLYSCNRTYNNKEFFYGNISEISKKQLEEKIIEKVKSRTQYIEKCKCKKCILYDECKGGCPANAYSMHKKIGMPDDSFCEAKIGIRNYVNNYIEKNGIKKDYTEMSKECKKII